MSTYYEQLKDPRWQRKRLEILNRDNFTCQNCGDNDRELHVHHCKYGKTPLDIDDEFLITYCFECHSYIEQHINIVKNNISLLQSIYPPNQFSEIVDLISIITGSQFNMDLIFVIKDILDIINPKTKDIFIQAIRKANMEESKNGR